MAHPEIVGFLQGLIENLTDHAPLLVFADWLEERGDYRADDLRRLVATYQTTPTHWKPTWPAEIAMSMFMAFDWGSRAWQHYIRRKGVSREYQIVPFPVEGEEHRNPYLEVLLRRYPPPEW